MYNRALPFLCILVLIKPAYGQDSSRLSVSFYGEAYYSYDFSRPNTHSRPPFLYNHNRTEEVNINLGLINASFTSDKVRANLGFMAGTYSNANLAAEPGVLMNLYQASAGVRLSKQSQLWIDAGVMPSHIGFESAIGKDNWTLTRSLAAENSPYYEAGVRISHSSNNQKWYAAILLLNGWQRIQKVEGNSTPAFGSQVSFKPNDRVLLNSSTFIGSDQPDIARRMRYFHNLYATFQPTNRIGVTVGFDLGLEQKTKGGSALNLWYTPVIVIRTVISPTKNVAVRGEYYQDKEGVIISKINGAPFGVWSCSSNFDWQVHPNVLWRMEARWMQNKYPIFLNRSGTYNRSNMTATTALCFYF
jgi:hypothetical protein